MLIADESNVVGKSKVLYSAIVLKPEPESIRCSDKQFLIGIAIQLFGDTKSVS